MELVTLLIPIVEQEEVEIPLKVIEEVEELRTLLRVIGEWKVIEEREEVIILLRTIEELRTLLRVAAPL